MAYIAEDIVCEAPAGRLEGAEAYRGFLQPFAEQLLLDATMLAAFGGEDTAVLVYDTRTVATPSAPGAEYVTVKDGRITASRFIFDRMPFEQFQRQAR
jgi:ketosteroid isomerase-like protein